MRYQMQSLMNLSWFLILVTEALTLVFTLLMVIVSPGFSSAIGFDRAEDIRPQPRKSSNNTM